MRSELHLRRMGRRKVRAAWQASAAAAALLAIAWVAVACSDESVVDPPVAAVASDAAPNTKAMAQASDRDILVALYEATDGPNWRDNTNWLSDKPLGEWYGVDTDADGRVVSIDLSGHYDFDAQQYVRHGLTGEIPPELGNLSNLRTLSLIVNSLTGEIPPELGSLDLHTLSLNANSLTGTIPPELGDLSNLGGLNLAGNSLTGEIPPELGSLDLHTLSLNANSLTGTIPPELGNLSNLRWLDLGANSLTGEIPPELGSLDLHTLSLNANSLTGTIPPELGNLSNLWFLDLHRNSLTGEIAPELGDLASLRYLLLNANLLTGEIPPELGNLSSLESLPLDYNQLSGTVPLTFLQLSRLSRFNFNHNAGLCLPDGMVAWYQAIRGRDGPVCPDRETLAALYESAGGTRWTSSAGWLGGGALDEWHGVEVDSAGLVSSVDLAGNGLSGGLTNRLGDLAGLTTLRVGDNPDLAGGLPSSLRQTPLRELRYANTDLCAPAGRSFQEWLAGLSQHEGTGLQCPPPSDREILTILYETTDGANWEESGNWVTDAALGTWHGVETDGAGRVVSLDLRWNGLGGPIPQELGGLAELETLILFRNRLDGPIPPELGRLAKAKLVVLADNELAGPIPPELGRLADLEELWLNGNRLTSAPAELGRLTKLEALSLTSNRLTSIPPELGRLENLTELSLNFNQLTLVPRELGGLTELEYLGLWSNELTSVPRELGQLRNLKELDLDENRLASVPPELGRLDSLRLLWLASNELTSIPAEINALNSLELLVLAENRLTAVPLRSGGFARLAVLNLSSNEFTSFPWQLGDLGNLELLDLSGNRLSDIPPGLGRMTGANRLASHSASDQPAFFAERWSDSGDPWRVDPDGTLSSLSQSQEADRSQEADKWGTIRARMGLGGNRSAGVRSRASGFPSLEVLDLSSNELRGSVPAGLLELTEITSLSLAENTGMTGALPLQLTAFELLDDLHTTGTGLCAPADPEFLDWLNGVPRQRVALCDRAASAAAYLTQAVQSREFPVPLVAGEPALLRVFVTADGTTGAGMPPVRATFYRDGAVTHVAEMPGTSNPIPSSIDESSLSRSANAEIPARVIQPGLEIVIEPDPGGTLDPALGVARRIPAAGRMPVDVRAMPVFEVTLVPFLWQENPNSSIVRTVDAMAADPAGHELFERTHLLLPISEIDATAHEPVTTSTNNGFDLLEQVEMIRVAEGGRGHYVALMAPPTTPGGLLGVAYLPGWSSFSILDAETIAHEFGHNRGLYHAPCGGAGGPDRYYPYGEGNIGAWGYDFGTGSLVPPGRPDFMSYCEPTWTSDYQFTNAVRYRLETETGSVLIATDSARTASGRTLMLWGGLDGEGAPRLRPSFFIDAPPALPDGDGPWRITGEDPAGAPLFSLSFAMAEFADSDGEHAGFSFAVPVTWTEELARITLQGPEGSALLDRDTDLPMTILRDPATRRIRGILEGPPTQAAPSSAAPAAARAAQDLHVIFSRGIPDPADARR